LIFNFSSVKSNTKNNSNWSEFINSYLLETWKSTLFLNENSSSKKYESFYSEFFKIIDCKNSKIDIITLFSTITIQANLSKVLKIQFERNPFLQIDTHNFTLTYPFSFIEKSYDLPLVKNKNFWSFIQ
jgi:hypothetical protein